MDKNTRVSEAKEAANSLLSDIETTDITMEKILLKTKRVARLLRDSDAQKWAEYELSGYPSNLVYSDLGSCEKYFSASCRPSEGGKYYHLSAIELEAKAHSEKQKLDNFMPKSSPSSAKDFLASNATMSMRNKELEISTGIQNNYLKYKRIVSGVKSSIHGYITDTVISLEFGDIAQSIFDELRTDVDKFIQAKAPQAAEKLIAISDRMSEGNEEACAEALTSCRRLLMTLADALFPAQSTDWVDQKGKARKVGTEQYKNRLCAFISTKISSSSTLSLIESDVEHLAKRIDAVYEKSCKGVHTDITIEEARLTIIQAYILIGELARADSL